MERRGVTDGHDEGSIDEFVGHDAAAARQLRASLRVLADHFAGEPLGQQVEAVLAGRASFRELAGDPELAALAHSGMQDFAEQWRSMTAEDRARLVREGEATAADLRRA